MFAGWGLTLASMAFPQSPVPNGSDELITRTYDLSGLRSSNPDWPGQARWLPIMNAGLEFKGPETQSFGSQFTSLFGDLYWEELEFEGRMGAEYGEDLWILRGPVELHAAFEGLRAFYAAWVQQRVVLQVDWVSAASPLASWVTPTEADQWLDGQRESAKVRTMQVPVPVDSFACVREQSTTRLITNASVEIAQGTATIDEAVRPVRFGPWGIFQACPQPGGTDVNLSWMDSEEPKIRKQSLDIVALLAEEGKQPGWTPLGGSLDLSDQMARAMTVNGFVPDGKVLVLSVGPAVGTGSMTVLIRRLPSPTPPPSYRSEGTKPFRMLGIQTERFKHRYLASGWDGEFDPAGYDMEAQLLSIDPRSNGSDLVYALTEDANSDLVQEWSQADFAGLRTNGSSDASLSAQEAELDRMNRRFESLLAPAANYSVRVSIQTGDSRPVLVGSLVTQEGMPMSLLSGSEHSEIHEFDVEVAGQASVDDPNVRLTLEGLMAEFRLQRVDGQGLLFESQGFLQVPVSKRTLDFDCRMHGAYETTQYSLISLDRTMILTEVEAGVWSARLGSMGKTNPSVVVEIRTL